MIKSKQIEPIPNNEEYKRIFGELAIFEPKHQTYTYTSQYADTITSVSVYNNADQDYALLWNRHTININTNCPYIGTIKFTTDSTVPTLNINNTFKKVNGCITSLDANSTYLIVVFYKMVNIIKLI